MNFYDKIIAYDKWMKTVPQCIGYEGKCDGDLAGQEHSENCPMHKVENSAGRSLATNLRDAFFKGCDESIRLQAENKQLIEALKKLPLEEFGDDMSKHDAAEFVDNAGAFFEAMAAANLIFKPKAEDAYNIKFSKAVDENLPDQRIRVQGWDGQLVHDCFYGKGSFDSIVCHNEICWRTTHDEKPVRYPIISWVPFFNFEDVKP